MLRRSDGFWRGLERAPPLQFSGQEVLGRGSLPSTVWEFYHPVMGSSPGQGHSEL